MFLTSLLDKMYQDSDIWIGMKYDDVNQTYRWLDGTIVQYTNWINKDPDPRQGKYVKVGLEKKEQGIFCFGNLLMKMKLCHSFVRKSKVCKCNYIFEFLMFSFISGSSLKHQSFAISLFLS